MMKCFSLIMLIAFIIICPLTADAYPAYELVMSSNIGDGEGTSDSIDDIPGFVVNGIRIYLGSLRLSHLMIPGLRMRLQFMLLRTRMSAASLLLR